MLAFQFNLKFKINHKVSKSMLHYILTLIMQIISLQSFRTLLLENK